MNKILTKFQNFYFSKVIALVLLCSIITFTISSCADSGKPLDSPAGEYLKGNHPLLLQSKVVEIDSITGAEIEKETYFTSLPSIGKVKFSWISSVDSTVVVFTLPVSEVRFKPCETCEIPSVKFKWTPGNNTKLEDKITLAVISCKPEMIIK